MSPGKTWTLAFRKALVDEALHRTPTGGFAELEKRHDLRPGTLFDWVGNWGQHRRPRRSQPCISGSATLS